MDAWNRRYPEWSYASVTNFGWDSLQAVRRLTNVPIDSTGKINSLALILQIVDSMTEITTRNVELDAVSNEAVPDPTVEEAFAASVAAVNEMAAEMQASAQRQKRLRIPRGAA